MEGMEKNEEKFISSVDLLKRTGLSRATLNNYIKAGILPHPIVKRPNDAIHSRAKRIGYFPDSVLGTLNQIIQYKKEGYPMERIRKILTLKLSSSPSPSKTIEILTTSDGVSPSDRGNVSGELFSYLDEKRSDYVPTDTPTQGNSVLPPTREMVFQDLFKQRIPIPLYFSILAAHVQDSIRICAEMPPEEYLKLINQIWICVKSSFEKYVGTFGKHAGNGFVYYFFKDRYSNYLMNPICCALELREKMKKLSDEWKQDKGWYENLYLNVGINEGYEFFGKISAAPAVEFITLGDTTHYVLRLSDFARCGSIWTTKNLLIRLDEKERKKIRYGIRRGQPTCDVLKENTFSRIADLLPHDSDKNDMFSDISTMTVAEIHNLH